jgi:hypothetical protein
MATNLDDLPKYDVEALRRNISQCDTNIETYEGIIEQEIARKAELKHLLRLCLERDALDSKD